MKAKLVCILLALSVAFGALAQQNRSYTVKGVITDTQQMPVPC